MATHKTPEHGAAVLARLVRTNKEVRVMLKLGKQLFGAKGAEVYPLDLLAYAAIKRNIATAEAMSIIIATWNMTTARTLLRVHIDCPESQAFMQVAEVLQGRLLKHCS